MADDEIGMRPKFRVTCGMCFRNSIIERYYRICADLDVVASSNLVLAFERTLKDLVIGKFDMVLREVFCSPLPTVGKKAFHNDMHYKCAREKGCDATKVFGVPIDEDYYVALMRRRGGRARILPREEWEKDAELKRQLSGLGYI